MMDELGARERFAAASVARLATIRPDGSPHLVPVTFATPEENTIWFLVDEKPKRSRDLQRLANIEAEGRVSLLVDHYEDTWSALWWVRADGRARVITDPEAWRDAVAALARKYPQYASEPPSGPAVEIRVQRWRWWAAAS
jgi:PPOX class probable F420-dependent enzyme